MSNVTVCVRFRPLSSKRKRDLGDNICIQSIDSETFIIKDEKEEGFKFSFDKIFYEKSKQADIYEFLVLPIVQDVFNAINGTIIAYGQTGARKTYSMEGPNILESDEEKRGILPRVVDGLFAYIRSSDDPTEYRVKLSMVEIYKEKVRDLFDLSKDDIQIGESRIQGIFLSGATESGIANRAIGGTRSSKYQATGVAESLILTMFRASNELIYKFHNVVSVKSGKLVLVDLAGSEKVEETGAEGKVLEQAKTINKSLSALGNVVNALTCGSPDKANHIPYGDSKLTRLLQDAFGESSRIALLCCCSLSPSNASESLSTLRFGERAKHIKVTPLVKGNEEKCSRKNGAISASIKEYEDHLKRMWMRTPELGRQLEECYIQGGLLSSSDSDSDEDLESTVKASQTISSLMQKVEKLKSTVEMLRKENKQLQEENEALKERNAAAERRDALPAEDEGFLRKILGFLSSFVPGR